MVLRRRNVTSPRTRKYADIPMRPVRVAVSLLAVVLASCTAADSPSPPTSPPTSPPAAVHQLILNVDTVGAVAGTRIRVRIQALDVESRRIETQTAVVTSSNSSVARLGNREVVNSRYSTGSILELIQDVELLAGGASTIRATLRERSESTTVHVRELEPSTAALVVDSFTVVEWATISYLVYSPLLRLREPGESAFADVIAVEFSLGDRSMGWCSPGLMRYTGGLSAHIVAIDPVFYNNDLLFVSLDGASIPGPAKVRVIVRDSDGEYGLVEAVAPIQRFVATPPRFTVPWHSGWQCGITPIVP